VNQKHGMDRMGRSFKIVMPDGEIAPIAETCIMEILRADLFNAAQLDIFNGNTYDSTHATCQN